MVLRTNIRFKLGNLDKNYQSESFYVKSSQHVLNDYDTTGNLNEFLEKCKYTNYGIPWGWFLGKLQTQAKLANSCDPHYKSWCSD